MRNSLRYFAILFCITLGSVSVLAQTSTERHQQIRAAVDAGDIKKALSTLRALRTADSGSFDANIGFISIRSLASRTICAFHRRPGPRARTLTTTESIRAFESTVRERNIKTGRKLFRER